MTHVTLISCNVTTSCANSQSFGGRTNGTAAKLGRERESPATLVPHIRSGLPCRLTTRLSYISYDGRTSVTCTAIPASPP